jgi:hypothetical protein
MKKKPIQIQWEGAKIDPKSQSSMTSAENPYEHLIEEQKEEKVGAITIMYRGEDNLAPQYDILLGWRSGTHKRIAQQLARLVAGNGIDVYVKNPETEGELSASESAKLELAKRYISLGLEESNKIVANGIVYQNLSSVVATNERAASVPELGEVRPIPARFVAYPSERLRFSKYEMNDFGEEQVLWHCYHPTWGYSTKKGKAKMPKLVGLPEYIRLSRNPKTKLSDYAFAVRTDKYDKSASERFVSFEVSMGNGIFDNAYPMPEWKTNTSINDIQSEFEASCIRIDYLKNGLHIFAIVNVYSLQFNTAKDNDFNAIDENWAENLDIVKGLKGSFNSGKIIVNPVGTDDPNLDGTIKVESIKLDFPVQQSEYFNQEARAGILTAWGVMADLFGISKPEKNNLRSQGEFLKIGIMLLQQQVRVYQQEMERGYDNILAFYGLQDIGTSIRPVRNSLFFAIMADLAAKVLTKDEIRDFIFDLEALSDEGRNELLNDIITNPQNLEDDDLSEL